MKPLSSEPTEGISDFVYHAAKKHQNWSDTHSIQQMALLHIHKQFLGIASGLLVSHRCPTLSGKGGLNLL